METRCVKPNDPHYPPLLKTIHNPPKQLYVRGNLDALKNPNTIAVVGTRKMTRYGQDSTRTITATLANAHFTIISGLAIGVDTIAHQTALEQNSPTIAVLGTGVGDMSITPRQNYHLAQKILKNNGALISEYPDGVEYGKWTFAARNRIIAGMAQATIVTEAAEKSGALITTHHAIDFNRDIFALPGPITSETSQGTNQLIAKGAFPILGPDTVPLHYGHTPSLQLTNQFSNPLTTKIHHLHITKNLTPEHIAALLNLPIQTILTHLTIIELQK